jgi:transcriptional regulator with XRE-family HTH domain
MCSNDEPCLDGILTRVGLSGLTRPEQAQRFGVARSQLLAVIAGNDHPSVIDRIATFCELTPDEIRAAMGRTRCPLRRGRRSRNAYGKAVETLCRERGITLDQLRLMTTVDRTSFYHALGEGGRPGLGHLGMIATVLEVPVTTLAPLIGEQVDHVLDVQRLEVGQSRRQFAMDRGLSVVKLFELSPPLTPSEAYRVTFARTGDVAAAQAAAAQVESKVHTDIGRMLRRWMDERGTSPAKLAPMLGVARQSIVAWSTGVALPSDRVQQRIATLLDVDIATIRATVRTDRRRIRDRRNGPGAELRSIRHRRRLTRSEYAALLGCSDLQIRLAESGHLGDDETKVLVSAAHGIESTPA